jgi:hypothetical protein
MTPTSNRLIAAILKGMERHRDSGASRSASDGCGRVRCSILASSGGPTLWRGSRRIIGIASPLRLVRRRERRDQKLNQDSHRADRPFARRVRPD